MIIHPKGDWFLGSRLPEFRTGWRDEQKRTHHLEIIGRHVRCLEHGDSSMMGIVHLKNYDGSYDLACLELQSHWPRLFKAGDEFLDLHGEYRTTASRQNKVAGSIDIAGSNSVNKARTHILATMVNIAAIRYFGDYQSTYVSTDLAQAAYLINFAEGFGALRGDYPKSVDELYVAYPDTRYRTTTWGYTREALRSKVRTWSVDQEWWVSLITPEDSTSDIGL